MVSGRRAFSVKRVVLVSPKKKKPGQRWEPAMWLIVIFLVLFGTAILLYSSAVVYGLIWPDTSGPKVVRRGLHLCRISEIKFSEKDPNSGEITYLTEDETSVTKEFTGVSKKYLEIFSAIPGDSRKGHLMFRQVWSIRFETIPSRVVDSWPSSFSLAGVPISKIKIWVQYRNGNSAVFSTYATYWLYFNEKIRT